MTLDTIYRTRISLRNISQEGDHGWRKQVGRFRLVLGPESLGFPIRTARRAAPVVRGRRHEVRDSEARARQTATRLRSHEGAGRSDAWLLHAANPSNVSYNVYRNGTMIANVTNSTNYLDSGGSASATYTVRAVVGGTVGADSETATVWAQNYLRVPLMVPAGGTTASSCPTARDGSSPTPNHE